MPPADQPCPVTGMSTGSARSSLSHRNPNSAAPPPTSGEWAWLGLLAPRSPRRTPLAPLSHTARGAYGLAPTTTSSAP